MLDGYAGTLRSFARYIIDVAPERDHPETLFYLSRHHHIEDADWPGSWTREEQSQTARSTPLQDFRHRFARDDSHRPVARMSQARKSLRSDALRRVSLGCQAGSSVL